MGFQQQFGLFRPVLTGEGSGHPERIEGMDVAPRRQHVGRTDQITARHGFDEACGKCPADRFQLAVLSQQRIDTRPHRRILIRHDVQVVLARFVA